MIRRMLTFAAISLGVTQFASASFVITYGGSCSPGVGVCTVTQTHTLPSQQLNVVSPQALFSFYNFQDAGLGLTAGATLTGATFDTVFDNILSALTISNNDTNTSGSSTIKVQLQSNPALDTNSTINAGDLAKIMGIFNPTDPSDGLSLGTGSGPIFVLADTGFQTLNSGDNYNYPGLPSTVLKDGNTFNFFNGGGPCSGNTGSPAPPSADNCASPTAIGAGAFALGTFPVKLTTALYNTTGSYTWGLIDTVSYAVTGSGSSGTQTIQVSYTSSYDQIAEITYSYTLPSTTPEPATMALFGSALVGLGLLRRRASRK
jgi:hypothetical protein